MLCGEVVVESAFLHGRNKLKLAYNFGGNQLLDGLISLSPLYPVPTIDLHVRIATNLQQSFP